MGVVVSLALATLCFANQCHPALVGEATPIGVFPLTEVTYKADKRYGGNLLMFQEQSKVFLAVHRVLKIGDRLKQLQSDSPLDRRNVTAGCINVAPEVFDALVESGETEITIED